ncbi:MAG: hypothetical protein VB853_08045 [Pirellulales bacterium]
MQSLILFGTSLPGTTFILISAAIGLFAGLWCARPLLQGTTLLEPWAWSLVSLVSVLAVEVIEVSVSPRGSSSLYWQPPIRYVAYLSTFCPLAALLGAKRPQNREWKYIVFAMWIVLATPAASTMMFPQAEFAANGIWTWLLLVLLCLNLANYLPTRFWLASILFAAAQFVLLHEHVAILNSTGLVKVLFANVSTSGQLACAICLTLAAVAAAFAFHRLFSRSAATTGVDRVWLDFRNSYGAVWALHIAERFNTASRAANWNIILQWNGLQHPPNRDGPPHDEEVAAAIEQSLRNLLRRFVASEWIDARLESQ